MLVDNSENYYELAWAVREAIFKKIIGEGRTDLHAVLDAFCDFECRHAISLRTQSGRINELGLDVTLLTGEARIEPIADTREIQTRAGELPDILRRIDLLAGFARQGFDAIVELGCGYGLNLFRLNRALGGRPMRYIGAEYTQSGRRLCARLAQLPGGMAVETAFIDHKKPDLAFMAGVEKALIFTCHSIEQVAAIPDDYFAVLAGAARRVLGVHLEPFGFQVACDTAAAKAQERLVMDKGWNTNFHARLRAAAAAGTVRLRSIELERFAAQAENPTSVAVWDNDGR